MKYEKIKAALMYGASQYPVEVPAGVVASLASAPSVEERARIAVAFFGKVSGGFHGSVRKDGALWSNGHGREYIAGNGWKIELFTDHAAYVSHCQAIVRLVNEKRTEEAGAMMKSPTFGEITAEALGHGARRSILAIERRLG